MVCSKDWKKTLHYLLKSNIKAAFLRSRSMVIFRACKSRNLKHCEHTVAWLWTAWVPYWSFSDLLLWCCLTNILVPLFVLCFMQRPNTSCRVCQKGAGSPAGIINPQLQMLLLSGFLGGKHNKLGAHSGDFSLSVEKHFCQKFCRFLCMKVRSQYLHK